LFLSPKGTKIKEQIQRERNNYERKMKEKLSTEELELIKEGLELIIKIFRQE